LTDTAHNRYKAGRSCFVVWLAAISSSHPFNSQLLEVVMKWTSSVSPFCSLPELYALGTFALPSRSTTSSRPVLMKNVGTAPSLDGGIALVSEHANLKLDKLTTYVLAASGPAR
jgi:hypothetical protein